MRERVCRAYTFIPVFAGTTCAPPRQPRLRNNAISLKRAAFFAISLKVLTKARSDISVFSRYNRLMRPLVDIGDHAEKEVIQ
jgi:hypothetical protein